VAVVRIKAYSYFFAFKELGRVLEKAVYGSFFSGEELTSDASALPSVSAYVL
jgi:hypothetical protein